MLRLRITGGIEAEEYTSRFLLPFEPIQKAMERFAEKGLAVQVDGRWRLTPKGLLLSNQIIGTLLEIQERSQPLTRKR